MRAARMHGVWTSQPSLPSIPVGDPRPGRETRLTWRRGCGERGGGHTGEVYARVVGGEEATQPILLAPREEPLVDARIDFVPPRDVGARRSLLVHHHGQHPLAGGDGLARVHAGALVLTGDVGGTSAAGMAQDYRDMVDAKAGRRRGPKMCFLLKHEAKYLIGQITEVDVER